MNYEFRHDFMGNAVTEFGRAFDAPEKTREHMVKEMNLRERNEWFQMYVMGGVPFPAYRARGL